MYVRRLLLHPGWRFDAEWEKPGVWVPEADTGGLCSQRAIDLPLGTPWHQGLRVSLRRANDLSKQFFAGGCHEANELACLARTLAPGMTVVDAGANERFHSILAVRSVGPAR